MALRGGNDLLTTDLMSPIRRLITVTQSIIRLRVTAIGMEEYRLGLHPLYISVVLAGKNRAWWGRSATGHDSKGFFSPGDTNGTHDFDNANHSYGFANPNIKRAS